MVTYEVVISAPNAELKLKPGLTASVTIYTAERKNVTCVSSKALRYTPTKETVGKRKIVDCNGKNKVWTLEGNNIVAHRVNIGMTDGKNTEILSGINNGAQVISGVSVKSGDDDDMADSDGGEKSPFAPGPPGKNKKK